MISQTDTKVPKSMAELAASGIRPVGEKRRLFDHAILEESLIHGHISMRGMDKSMADIRPSGKLNDAIKADCICIASVIKNFDIDRAARIHASMGRRALQMGDYMWAYKSYLEAAQTKFDAAHLMEQRPGQFGPNEEERISEKFTKGMSFFCCAIRSLQQGLDSGALKPDEQEKARAEMDEMKAEFKKMASGYAKDGHVIKELEELSAILG